MADNIDITPGAGVTIKTKERGDSDHIQIVSDTEMQQTLVQCQSLLEEIKDLLTMLVEEI